MRRCGVSFGECWDLAFAALECAQASNPPNML